MTEDELDAVLQRAEAAGPGPWWSSWEGRDHESGDSFVGTGTQDSRGPDLYISADGVPAPVEVLDFIAAARQDVPALVAEIRRLRQSQQ
ncbi:MAG: hypothetical protein LCI03_06530 [Actinobacteria bacterium]|nr:hypothetical protein [Actinomycetota bacterium]